MPGFVDISKEVFGEVVFGGTYWDGSSIVDTRDSAPVNGDNITMKEAQTIVTRWREEADPTGLVASQPGAKLDQGKIMMSLLLDFNLAIKAVAEVATIGAKKYSRGGWKTVPDGYNRYTDAMIRHLFADGEYDTGKGGTGLLHDAQVAWNALARLQMKLVEFKKNEIATRVEV